MSTTFLDFVALCEYDFSLQLVDLYNTSRRLEPLQNRQCIRPRNWR